MNVEDRVGILEQIGTDTRDGMYCFVINALIVLENLDGPREDIKACLTDLLMVSPVYFAKALVSMRSETQVWGKEKFKELVENGKIEPSDKVVSWVNSIGNMDVSEVGVISVPVFE
jgi:hypothetical protein